MLLHTGGLRVNVPHSLCERHRNLDERGLPAEETVRRRPVTFHSFYVSGF